MIVDINLHPPEFRGRQTTAQMAASDWMLQMLCVQCLCGKFDGGKQVQVLAQLGLQGSGQLLP